jgi:hypothetical protein
VWWPAADELLGVSDNGGFIDLELRSHQFDVQLAAGRERDLEWRRFEALNGEEDNILGHPY